MQLGQNNNVEGTVGDGNLAEGFVGELDHGHAVPTAIGKGVSPV